MPICAVTAGSRSISVKCDLAEMPSTSAVCWLALFQKTLGSRLTQTLLLASPATAPPCAITLKQHNFRMKRVIIYISTIACLMACANDDYVGGGDGSSSLNGGTIGFGSGVTAITRSTGSAAANELGNTFYVYGIKNEGTNGAGNTGAQDLVFDNYKVTFSDGTANTTASNTSGWEYVGQSLSTNEVANIKGNSGTRTQTIKYWDTNAKDYTYYAFSAYNKDSNGNDAGIENGDVQVQKITNNTGSKYSNGYTVTLNAKADPSKLYFSNRLNIQQGNYNNPVTFAFRNAMAKVRVGMYETIPGYSVTIDGFEVVTDNTNPTFAQMGTQVTTGFAANLASNKKGDEGTMIVTYRSNDYPDENRPVVSFNRTGTTVGKDAVLYLGDYLKKYPDTDLHYLGTSTADLVYDKEDKSYTDVYPMENNVNNLKLKVDFTLHSKVGETITVKGATAEVPAQYLQWKPGCAYTYIFKISDQTNGVLGSITGLHPITFEAVNIIDGTGEDELISTTTAANYNIITLGCDADHKVTVGQDDYNADDEIYAVVVYGKPSTGTSGTTTYTVSAVTWDENATDKATKLYEVTTDDAQSHPITEASVENYLNNYESNANLLDAHVTAILVADGAEDKAQYVTEVPKGDETSGTNSLNAMKWTAKNTVYAVEYTVPNTSTKYYKVVRVDGFGGEIKGELTLSPNEVNNVGGTLTPTLTINGETITSGVTYALDGTANDINVDRSTGKVTVAGNSVTAGIYTVIATYNRRTYKATFKVLNR